MGVTRRLQSCRERCHCTFWCFDPSSHSARGRVGVGTVGCPISKYIYSRAMLLEYGTCLGAHTQGTCYMPSVAVAAAASGVVFCGSGYRPYVQSLYYYYVYSAVALGVLTCRITARLRSLKLL